MTTADLARYKTILEGRAAELAQRLRIRGDIAIEPAPDLMDGIMLAAQRDAAVRELDQMSRMMADIRAALKRVDRKEFGECIECGDAISVKRLQALPWAARCISCQERWDARQSDQDNICGHRGTGTSPDPRNTAVARRRSNSGVRASSGEASVPPRRSLTAPR